MIIVCALITILCYRKKLYLLLLLILSSVICIRYGSPNILIYAICTLVAIFLVIRYLIDIIYHFVFFNIKNNDTNDLNSEMSFNEAKEVLNVKDNANKEEIIQAYYSMMKKNHPDHGGSEYMAKKIICAKNILMKSFNNA